MSATKLLKSRSAKITSQNKTLLILSLKSMLEIFLSLTCTHTLTHCLIKGGQSEGQQYFYTVKCDAEVAPETQNKLALLPALALTFSLLQLFSVHSYVSSLCFSFLLPLNVPLLLPWLFLLF